MEHRKKMFMTMLAICAVYLFATCTAILFLYLLFQGEFIRAGIVLLIELFIFTIGRELRRTLWVK
jgi:hypothetical protein